MAGRKREIERWKCEVSEASEVKGGKYESVHEFNITAKRIDEREGITGRYPQN